MSEIGETLKRIKRQRDIDKFRQKFYADFLPTITGRVYDTPRSYGHARFEIVGHPNLWRSTQDSQKVYFHYENNVPVLDTNALYDTSLCIVVKRLGGFDGPGQNPGLIQILSAFQS